LLSIRYKSEIIRLTDEQWARIRDHFSEENISDGGPGRKPVSSRRVLEVVLWILNTGAQWHMLLQSYPNYKTVHRHFRVPQRDSAVLMDVANELRDIGALDQEEYFIDATFVMTKGGRTDRHGSSLSVSTHAANHHELGLVQL
jgi:transposase